MTSPVEDQAARTISYAEELRVQAAMRDEGDPEAWAICALIQGMFAGQTMLPGGPIQAVVKVAAVETDADVLGNYVPYFTIVTAAGHRLRVSVNPEPQPKSP